MDERRTLIPRPEKITYAIERMFDKRWAVTEIEWEKGYGYGKVLAIFNTRKNARIDLRLRIHRKGKRNG